MNPSLKPVLRSALFPVAALLAVGLSVVMSHPQAQEVRVVPEPALDMPADTAPQVAILAGGCFWGVQGVFQHTAGVTNAVSGYAGGDMRTARYDLVSNGSTAHAEAVQVTFDPRVISYGRLLQIFFSVVHDPTQLDRQGPDLGPQYRSAIFPANEEQARIAKAYIDQLDGARAYPAPIVTRIESGQGFFAAEAYHQDFMARNPRHGYIVAHDVPKVDALKRLFPALYRDTPVLVSTAAAN